MSVLAINCGSSSLKYALFDGDRALTRGTLDRIGSGGAPDHTAAVYAALDRLPEPPRAIGHRLVHGGRYRFDPVVVDEGLLATLGEAVPLAPLHLPIELRAIEAVRAKYGGLPQVACFDTAFHRTLPETARRLPLPRSLYDAGVQCYGFHGLSYEYIASVVPADWQRRAVFAHLGSGASMVAVQDGRAIATTMAFTPAAGLVMGTRSGNLDPGLIVYLLQHFGYDARSLGHLVNSESGLRALSETTSDMKELVERRGSDPRAALAVDVFCDRARMTIGGYAAALGGLDTLVFTGGIGEHAAAIRAQICDRLRHLGIAIDPAANVANAAAIATGACAVLVVGTDEEKTIARHTARVAGMV